MLRLVRRAYMVTRVDRIIDPLCHLRQQGCFSGTL
jgi:hypothetical protein